MVKVKVLHLYISGLSYYSIASIFVLGVVLSSTTYWPIDMINNNNSKSFIQSSYLVTAQTDSDNPSNFNQLLNHNSSRIQQNDGNIVKAYGHFANNQIKDNVVTWIEGGMWNLNIEEIKNRSVAAPNMTADFNANFTMIKPDGRLSHNHMINNFKSNNVIFAGNDIVITGTSDIHSDSGIEYSQVPITVHLMGKKVLGLMIDVNKTNNHFASDNEMFGTLISGFGLETSETGAGASNLNSNNLTNREIPSNTSSTSPMGLLNHAMHYIV